jgi:anaerobic ribonucleoside-triphosphate reductase activating protein
LTANPLIRLYRIAYPVTSLGPGNRVALWVAGCSKRCKGCISPEMHDPSAGKPIAVATLAKRLGRLDAMIDGITISGGEPMDQADALATLVRMIKKQRPEWNIIVYTGYSRAKAGRLSEGAKMLLASVDVLIDGEYRMSVLQKHPLAGSGNQKIHCLSDVGKNIGIDNCTYGAADFGIDGTGQAMLIGILNARTRVKAQKKWTS